MDKQYYISLEILDIAQHLYPCHVLFLGVHVIYMYACTCMILVYYAGCVEMLGLCPM